ncbi:monovalent cation/H+ antiporter subunit D [Bartonella sp. 1-1C]|uniref:monovalent cation/H+ antiporter subunit D n=1 Tax=Bartonella sp. 1-1C TaxID=515256 RepID=UPI0001F4C86D|nr:monovalent cation/H+ antiporter subunit D [Bartonella sp. 1-1C]ATO58017.1 multisubunit potassium/proton antiporter, PhaD subunit [Bartonella sp. 1-1C]CBI81501.1 multicomponent K+:H+ antiporter subunit D [Bartonella sp. 1-1C]
MEIWLQHLLILPILLPLTTGALLLFYDERNSQLKSLISLSSAGLLIVISILLCLRTLEIAPASDVYQLGNWPSPFAIILVLDRLSALMLLLSSVLTAATFVFSQAYWYKVGPHFQSLMQFLIVGINGAFLTGDLFNLFVFFEVMLTASYGLALHGSGQSRVRAGMHYIVINLFASFLFLTGTALIYGIVGTLNMADLAVKIRYITSTDIVLFEIGVALLGVALLLKVGLWPLNFWLVPTYCAAAAPVSASFAILSKVGIYVILRLTLLWFGPESGYFTHFGSTILFYGGLATLTFGFIGVLASQVLGRLAAYSVLVSSGTVLTAIGTRNILLTAGTLFYIVSSTLALGAFFLLVELVERNQDVTTDVLDVTTEVYNDEEEEEEDEVGTYLPVTLAILGACFAICAILIIGLPPLSGFIAKFMMIMAILNPKEGNSAAYMPVLQDWLFVIFIIISGFATLISMTKAGIRIFWVSLEGKIPRAQVIEFTPIAALLVLCFVATMMAGPISHYMYETAKVLHSPKNYISSILTDFSLKKMEKN